MNPLPQILHIANSYPHAVDKDRFYTLKLKILMKHGTPDGFDVQHFLGKECWNCDGTGTFYHASGTPDQCDRCCGGWHKLPKWVRLPRWKFGRFVFHSVGEVTHSEAVVKAWGEPAEKFTGFLAHKDYTIRQMKRAHMLLGLLCDWGYMRAALAEVWRYSRWAAFFTKRCADCRRHLWPLRRYVWRCDVCERVRELVTEDPPF